MSTPWAEISCTVPDAMVDPLAEFLVDLSRTGVTVENLSVDTFSLDTLVDTPDKTREEAGMPTSGRLVNEAGVFDVPKPNRLTLGG